MTAGSTRPRRRGRKRWVLVLAILAGVIFVAGIALGEALHDNPEPGGEQTIVRTLNPLPLLPAPATTITVTTAKP